MVATFILDSERERGYALAAVMKARLGQQVRISKPTRTKDQNARLHAVLTDIADQLAWPPPPRNDGKFHDVEWWKRRCTLGWLKDNKEIAEIVTGLEDDGEFAILLPHTGDLPVDQFASLVIWTESLGAKNGVVFKEPKGGPEPPPREDDR